MATGRKVSLCVQKKLVAVIALKSSVTKCKGNMRNLKDLITTLTFHNRPLMVHNGPLSTIVMIDHKKNSIQRGKNGPQARRFK